MEEEKDLARRDLTPKEEALAEALRQMLEQQEKRLTYRRRAVLRAFDFSEEAYAAALKREFAGMDR